MTAVRLSTPAVSGLAGRVALIHGRGVDAGAADHWVGRLRGGTPLVDVEVAILGSPEMWGRGGGPDEGYVDALDGALLGRDPSPSERTFWARRSGAKGRAVVSRELLGAPEVERRRTAAAHLDILDEAIADDDLATAAAALDQHRDLRRIEAAFAARWELARPE